MHLYLPTVLGFLEIAPMHFLFCNSWVCKNVLTAMSGYKDSSFNGSALQKDPALTTAAIHPIQSLKQDSE